MGSRNVSIGEMKDVGLLYRRIGVETDTGGEDEITTSALITNVRGKLERKGGGRQFEAGVLKIMKTYTWTCYLQAGIEDELRKQDLRWNINTVGIFTVVDWELYDNFYFVFTLVNYDQN